MNQVWTWTALSEEDTVQAAVGWFHIILAKSLGPGIRQAWVRILPLTLTGGELGKVTSPF